MHMRMLPSFFFTRRTGAPNELVEGRIYLLARYSSICLFVSYNSSAVCLYNLRGGTLYAGVRSIAW